MTKEEKELVVKDLCARLPYGVIVQVNDGLRGTYDRRLVQVFCDRVSCSVNVCNPLKDCICIDSVKPYLRSMESMTEEECDMVEVILGNENIFDFMRNGDIILKEGNFTQVMLSRLYDYFNSIHVDYRGLIPKGFAIEAPDGMYDN